MFAIVASWIIIVFSSELSSALVLQLWDPVKTVGSELIELASAIAYLWWIWYVIPWWDFTLTPAVIKLENSLPLIFSCSIIPLTFTPNS